jgi:plasmid maintenance system antidote protein VapI
MIITPADQFEADWLPHRPRAGDFASLTRRMSRDEALGHRLIEANCTALRNTLVVDLDKPDAYEQILYVPRTTPEPSWVAVNPKNGHLHAGWRIRGAVCVTDAGKPGPLNYLARVERGLLDELGGDRAYTGYLTKNPLSPDWVTQWLHTSPRDLGDLAAGLRHFPAKPAKKLELATGLGRNSLLFETGRVPTYRMRRTWTETLARFEDAVTELAWTINCDNFATPLGRAEVGHTARSMARWSWRNIDPNPRIFVTIQTRRGVKGTKIAADKRRIDRSAIASAAQPPGETMPAEIPKRRDRTAREVAAIVGCSPRTIQRVQAEPRQQFEARARQRRDLVLALKEEQGLTYREIADAMGLSVSNVGYLLHEARKERASADIQGQASA